MLGILVLPMSPVSGYLAGPDDAAAALEASRDLPDERIDDGSTRSYLLASITSRL
ncbi:hypothetical protein [Sanguibacter antarcticus]|uniref:Uncharacterized protein n=1 Tax=Sanguibacter antarcticus TaxID=372484 RepID=A0A2A9E6U2_9MICO|nr:hypothetical protein [Sanguibacter antarcticus]PFG34366.1 hypothetical protein ATL42_2275 [Sanguibacter antarcticus]